MRVWCPWCERSVGNIERHLERACEHIYIQWLYSRLPKDRLRLLERHLAVWKSGKEMASQAL